MSHPSPEANAFDLLPELGDALDEQGIDYRVLGGLSAQLVSTAEEVDTDIGYVWGGPRTYKTQQRPENGTARDADVLIMTEDPEVVAQANEIGEEVFAGRLVMSGFRFKRHAEHMQAGYGLARRLGDFTTERTMGTGGRTYYVAHPLVHEVSADSYASWTAVLDGGRTFKTVNPAASAAAYIIRSVGGVRPRNRADVNAMRGQLTRLVADYPDFEAQSVGDWLAFRKKLDEVSLRHVAQELRHGNSTRAADLMLFMGRRGLIGYLDAQPWAVNAAQGGGLAGKKLAPLLDRMAGGDRRRTKKAA